MGEDSIFAGPQKARSARDDTGGELATKRPALAVFEAQ